MSVKNLLKHSNWIAINKQMVKLVGCNAAYMLGYLADKHDYFEGKNELNEGYFYATAADVEADIHLSGREQDTAISRLAEQKIIETKLKGIPARRHFRFTDDAESILTDVLMCKTSFDKSAKLDTTKAQSSKPQKSETIYKEDILISDIKKESNKLLSTRENFNFAIFDFECYARGYNEIKNRIKQKQPTATNQHPCAARFTESEMNAKIALWGEAYFWDMIGVINAYLENNSKYKAVSLPKMLTAWFGDKEHLAVQLGINEMWQQKHGFDFKKINEWTKADLVALKSIAVKMTERAAKKAGKKAADVSHEELKTTTLNFFLHLPEKWANTKWFSIEKISSEYSLIIVEMKKEASNKVQTLAPATPADAKEQAIKTLAEIGLTDEMIALIQSPAKCADLQTAKNLTISQLFKAGKFDAANGDKFNQCLKVLRPMLR
jgi:hypothetical protein